MRKRVFSRQLGIPVPEEVYQKIVSLCDEQEVAVAQWVRGAIELKMTQGDNNVNKKEE